ncbi:MAG: phosphotransferase [Bacteroidota bacterium]
MNSISVSHSTISAGFIGSFVKKQYGLNGVVKARIIKTGIAHTYLIEHADEKFVFRVYFLNWRTEVEITEEIKLLNLLKENNVSVSFPITGINDEYIQTVNAPEGMRFAVLFSYAEGSKVRVLNEKTSYNIGILMANFHQLSENLSLKRIDYNAQSLLYDSYEQTTKHFSKHNEEMQFIRKAADHIDKLFKNADETRLRKGVVHLDIWYDNMHINSESEMTIFDFDFCGNGWLLHDIAYFLTQLFHIEPDKQQYEAKKKAFLEGYEYITRISDEEKRLLPYSAYSIWVFYLGIQSSRFDDWSNLFLSENYLPRFMGMGKAWLKYYGVEV